METSKPRPFLSRRMIAFLPVMLILGIVAQVIILMILVIGYIPALIWPDLLTPFGQKISRGMVRVFVRGGMRGMPKGREMVSGNAGLGNSLSGPGRDLLPFRDVTRRGRCLHPGASRCNLVVTVPIMEAPWT